MIAAADDVLVDAIADPFAAANPSDPWFHVRMQTYASDDGVVARLPNGGFRLVPPAKSGRTGEPQFTASLAPESRNGGIPAANDHAKWLAYLNRVSAAQFPGFDARPGSTLAGTARLTARTFGTHLHPFGAAVEDPDSDLRLATSGMTTIDIESWMVFDVLLTNRRVYAIYERLPFGRTATNAYAAFTYAIPLAARRPDDWHEATIAYDIEGGRVRWTLDGTEVLCIDDIGHHLDSRQHMLIDLGGTPQLAKPRQLAFGLGLFTLLDGALGSSPGLVRLSDAETYYSPRHTGAQALSFVDDESRPESRLFGQGADLSVSSYIVYRKERGLA